MRYQRILFLLFGLLLFTSTAWARKGDWHAVENLSPGTHISVLNRQSPARLYCSFERATARELFCRQLTRPSFLPIYLPPISSEVAFERRDIVEVRLEHSDATNAAIGGAIGAGAGAALGAASSDSHSRGAGMALFSVLGFALGSAINRALPITPRKVIYRR